MHPRAARPLAFIATLALALAGLALPAADSRSVDVVAFYFPNYHVDARNAARYGPNWTEWELLRQARPRFPGHDQPKIPAWGYEDEARPEVFARKIEAAANHGITALLFDWYWHDRGPFLARGLEDGFLQATNRARLRFGVMWANHDWLELFPARAGTPPRLHDPGAVTPATFRQATDHVIQAYFSQSNHWQLAGRPVFSIYETMTLIRGLGGVAETRAALDDFRARARAAGHAGVHLNAIAWGLQPPAGDPTVRTPADLVRALGIDSVTSYCWAHHVAFPGFPGADYAAWSTRAFASWPDLADRYPVPYFPNVSMGWDSSPRTGQEDTFANTGYPFTAVVTNNTPKLFQEALSRARAFTEKAAPGLRVVTVNAWNEWTEGSYLEPDRVHGDHYLEAVRTVFGDRPASGARPER